MSRWKESARPHYLRKRLLAGAPSRYRCHNWVWPSRFYCECVRALLLRLGFEERIKGSHHVFTREDVDEILNLQPRKSLAKPYQVKQVRKILVQYKLAKEAE